jgi:hypothetical protein
MKRFALLAMLALFGVIELFAQYPLRTIRELQQVPLDSLRRLDTLQRTVLSEWTKQHSRYYRDTVRVRGICVVPAKVINFTANGYNLLIADTTTANRTEWGGLFVRPNLSTGSPDTILAIQWGIANVAPGDYIEFTGYIDEFPSGDPVSATQIVPIFSQPLIILNSLPLSAIPPHVPKIVSDFYKGPFPSPGPNGIQFSTGEPMEFMRVRLTNLIYVSALNATNGTMNLQVQATGDQISTMDASKWFTTRGHRDPNSTYVLPPINTRIDTLWGYVMTNSGAEASRGYRIAPIYPGDIRYGVALPFISTHRRNPVVVTPDSSPVISCRVTRGGVGISAVQLRYSINNAVFTTVAMTLNLADTTYRASIPQQVANTNVRYFINVIDSVGNTVKLASSATDGTQADTLRGFFFYNVLNRPLTIQDIQTTPYSNGRTPYLGATVTLRGIVTADTANINIAPLTTGGTSSWYMQSGNAPWSGIWVVDTLMRPRRNGDSLTITGVVAENFDVTRIERLTSSPIVNTTGVSLPAPVVQTTGVFGPAAGNGTIAAERYEGMLVRFNNVRVSNLNPTFADPTEFEIDDGSGPIIVRRDGTHNFSNIPGDTINGRTILRLNEVRSFIQGIIYYSFNRYKLCPRTNSDWGTTSVEIDHSPQIPSGYSLTQNYPNPFNPSTTIEFTLPKTEDVSVKVFNTLGQEVETLLSGKQAAGKYTIRFDASRLTTGMYFYRLQAGEFVATKKMLLVK